MSLSEFFPISGYWWIDLAILVVIASVLLYLARGTAHDILIGLTRSLASGLRVAQRALQRSSEQLVRAADGAALLVVSEHQQRLATRELGQLRADIDRALAEFPTLRTRLDAQVEQVEADYRRNPDQPVPPASWGELVARVASIRAESDPALQHTLEAVQHSIEQVGRRLADRHREESQEATRSLDHLRPTWDRIATTLDSLDTRVRDLGERVDATAKRLRRFETIRNQRQSALRRFRGWLALSFGISGFLLLVALLIGLVNFHLVLIPLEETFGANATTGPFATPPLVALTLTTAQLALALLIADTARLTHLFPLTARLDKGRRRVVLIGISLLLVLLALTEAGLAFMRDTITLEAEWLARELEQGIITGEPGIRLIPSLSQMAMGFVLPLSFIALAPALESFFQTGRVALLLLAGLICGVAATLLRLLARLISSAGHLAAYLYDLLIAVPLSLERRFRRREPNLGGDESA